jgi:glycosyltransferase involved in cell wall biosynthesis
MRILQLCNKPPYPAIDGGCRAMAEVTEGLLACGDHVRVACIGTHKHPYNPQDWPTATLAATNPIHVPVDTGLSAIRAFMSLLGDGSYHLERFDSAAMHAALAGILQKEDFDVIHLESLFVTPYIPTIRRHSSARIVLRAHNVEHQLWQRLAANETSPVKRGYLRILAQRLKKAEAEALRMVDAVVAITQNDLEALKALYPIANGHVLPMTMVPPASVPLLRTPLTAFHLGSMDWMPNAEGIRWFVKEVWPLAQTQQPEMKCRLAGRNMPHDLTSDHSFGLDIVGEVNDAQAFMLSNAILVLPLLSGGGMRVKLVEAMMLGRAVVTTTLGMEGVPAVHGEHLLVADTPQTLADALVMLYRDPDLTQRLATAGRELALAHFGRDAAMQRLRYFYGQPTAAQ